MPKNRVFGRSVGGVTKVAFIVDIDTEELKQAAAIARRANEAITAAMNLLNRIVVHNDWECAERDAINDNTIRNKNDARYIQQCAEQFYRNVEMSADLFRQAEQELRQSFETVEGPLGTFLSLVPQNEAQPGVAQIAMCSFENISSAIKGAVK